ncbi:MAG TPA: hypothetical protein K8U88_02425, partial [Levilactobacillus hammesii]|nr:hypothetical protein [Levilactobacillus hammesii]
FAKFGLERGGQDGPSLRNGLFPRFEPKARVSKTPVSKQNTWKLPRLRPNLTHSRLHEVSKLAERGHSSDVIARSVVFNHRNRNLWQPQMVLITRLMAVSFVSWGLEHACELSIFSHLIHHQKDSPVGDHTDVYNQRDRHRGVLAFCGGQKALFR